MKDRNRGAETITISGGSTSLLHELSLRIAPGEVMLIDLADDNNSARVAFARQNITRKVLVAFCNRTQNQRWEIPSEEAVVISGFSPSTTNLIDGRHVVGEEHAFDAIPTNPELQIWIVVSQGTVKITTNDKGESWTITATCIPGKTEEKGEYKDLADQFQAMIDTV